MKKCLMIFCIFSMVHFSFSQENTAKNIVKERKFIHQTELGFLLGEQRTINQGGYYPYPMGLVDSRYAYYPPIYNYVGRSNTFSFQHFSGYKIKSNVAAGISGGLDYYPSNVITPLALGVRWHLLNRRISPQLAMDAGYGFIWKNKQDKEYKYEKFGGLMLNPSGGLRVKLGEDGSALLVSLGFRMQKSGYENNVPEQQYYLRENRTFNRLSLRLGFEF